MTDSLVSVVIPAHNRAHMVCDALASVRAQTHPRIETIVVDDGSTDETREVVEKFPLAKRVFHLETARGPSAARNLGVAQAHGNYVLFLDDDDLIHPRHIEQLAARAARNRPSAVICGQWRRFAWGSGEQLRMGPVNGGKPVAPDDLLLDIITPQGEGSLALMACLWPLDLCRNVHWDEELFTNGDVDFYGRCIMAGWPFVAADAGMGYYRSHTGPQVAGKRSDRGLRSSTRYRMMLCERLSDHPNCASYAPGIRAGLMSLMIAWAQRPAGREVVSELMKKFREWGGRRLYLPAPPRNPLKRAVAGGVLAVAGVSALGRLLRWSKRRTAGGGEESRLAPAGALDRDDEDFRVIKQFLWDKATVSAVRPSCEGTPMEASQ